MKIHWFQQNVCSVLTHVHDRILQTQVLSMEIAIHDCTSNYCSFLFYIFIQWVVLKERKSIFFCSNKCIACELCFKDEF